LRAISCVLGVFLLRGAPRGLQGWCCARAALSWRFAFFLFVGAASAAMLSLGFFVGAAEAAMHSPFVGGTLVPMLFVLASASFATADPHPCAFHSHPASGSLSVTPGIPPSAPSGPASLFAPLLRRSACPRESDPLAGMRVENAGTRVGLRERSKQERRPRAARPAYERIAASAAPTKRNRTRASRLPPLLQKKPNESIAASAAPAKRTEREHRG
jgi:hypothetical protein